MDDDGLREWQVWKSMMEAGMKIYEQSTCAYRSGSYALPSSITNTCFRVFYAN